MAEKKERRMRLIDADALDRAMYHKSFETDDGRQQWNSGLWIRYKIYEEAVRDAPTIDAVPVIRCKDCKHCAHMDELYPVCTYFTIQCSKNGFCSWAERREE